MSQTKETAVNRRYVRDYVRPVFSSTVPTYVLDTQFRFIDWNTAFQELVAGPLQLTTGMPMQKFLNNLDNGPESAERALKVFSFGRMPLVDTEPLIYNSYLYGPIEFRKIAVQVTDPRGQPLAWIVTLNIANANRLDDIMMELVLTLEREVTWSSFALMMDSVLPTSAYFRKALDTVLMTPARNRPINRILSLGSSTGRDLARLLELHPEATLTTLELNGTMKELIQRRHLGERSKVINAVPDELSHAADGEFDACFSFDGMNRCPHPDSVLTQMKRILAPGGFFSFAVLRSDFDVGVFVDTAIREAGGLLARHGDEQLAQDFNTMVARVKAQLPERTLDKWVRMIEASDLIVELADPDFLRKQATLFIARTPDAA